MSRAAVREQAETKFMSLSREEQSRKIGGNISDFEQHQAAQHELLGSIKEVGGKIDLSTLQLSEIRGHTDAMNQSIAELILGLEGTTKVISGEIESLQTNTFGEKIVGFLSPKKASAMREARVRSADISDNLQNLLTKSNQITVRLQSQLDVIVEHKGVVERSIKQVLAEREQTITEKVGVTSQLDALAPELSALQERVQAEADPAARAAIQSEFETKNARYNELKGKEAELLAASQTLEGHIETYRTYLESLTTQESTQRVLLTKFKIDTQHRALEWPALLASMKTASVQDNAHRLNEVGVATDKKGREVMAGIAVATERRLGDMLSAHGSNMQQAAFVQDQRRKASVEFDAIFGTVMKEHDEGDYAER